MAAGVCALGARCSLLTVVGDDLAGEELVALMAGQGVDVEAVIERGARTTQKTRLISGVQQIARIDHDGDVSEASRAELARRFAALLDGVSAVIFSDYDKGALSNLPDLLAIARQHGVPAFVDPKIADRARYRLAGRACDPRQTHNR